MCNSWMTGHFIETDYVPEWVTNEALRHGEIVFVVDKVPKENCVCIACRYTWEDEVPIKFLSIEKINEQKRLRYTNVIYNNRLEEERKSKEYVTKKGKVKIKKKNFLARFIGPI